jgi:hypothetical protein
MFIIYRGIWYNIEKAERIEIRKCDDYDGVILYLFYEKGVDPWVLEMPRKKWLDCIPMLEFCNLDVL